MSGGAFCCEVRRSPEEGGGGGGVGLGQAGERCRHPIAPPWSPPADFAFPCRAAVGYSGVDLVAALREMEAADATFSWPAPERVLKVLGAADVTAAKETIRWEV